MSDLILTSAYASVSYFVGAVPFAYVLGRVRHRVDIRDCGNGNVGTVNAFRSLGWRDGVAVLLLDGAKGAVVAVAGAALDMPVLGLFAGAMAATIGHNWSVYIGFGGGKGVAVVFGISLGMMPLLSWLAAPFVFATYAVTRSWVWAFGAGIAALNVIIWLSGAPTDVVMMCVILSILVVATHLGREAGELWQAILARDWRKIGQLE